MKNFHTRNSSDASISLTFSHLCVLHCSSSSLCFSNLCLTTRDIPSELAYSLTMCDGVLNTFSFVVVSIMRPHAVQTDDT